MFAAAAKWSLWLLLAAWLVLALAWGALHAFIVPRIADLRPRLELEAGRALGVPVRIGQIRAESGGLLPSFELLEVVLLDAQGRPALRLPRVVAQLSPRSVLNFGFEQLVLDRPELEVRRATDGRIFVAGLDLSRASDNEGRAADWFFSQREFVLRGGTLRWHDELRGAPPLALGEVDFIARNRPRHHQLRLDATPPPQWGARFTVLGTFRQALLAGSPGRWQDWVGQVHGDFGAVDVSRLQHHLPLGFALTRGHGRLRAWADVERGQVVGATADVLLRDVQAQLRPELQPLALASVSGRLGGKRLAHGFEFHTSDLQFLTREGLQWPGGNVALNWTGPEGQAPARGELRADRLDLAALGAIASRLPLAPALHAALADHAPQGLVESLHARWQGPLDAVQKYEARGSASGLGVAAHPARGGGAGTPGVRGARIEFDLHDGGGKAKLSLADGALELPGVLEEPVLPLARLDADVQWQLEGERIAVQVSDVQFANADLEGRGRLSWRTGEPKRGRRFPGELDLEATLARADGARVWRYLPLAVGREAREYVRTAILAGTAADAKFRVKGPLAEFPFAGGRTGQFLVTAPVRDVHFAYVPTTDPVDGPPWPALTQLAAQLVFEGDGMQIRNATAQVAGMPRLQVQAQARIPRFSRAEVAVQGRIRGPLADALHVVNHSPVAALLDGALAQASGSGPAEVELRLDVPVHDPSRARVQGAVTLAGNDVHVTPASPLLGRVRGVVQFTDQGFQLAGVQARALGGDVRLEGGTRPAAVPGGRMPVVLRAQGTLTAEALRQAPELGFVSRLARDLAGATQYQLVLGLRGEVPEILVTSNLQGLAIQLPAPLHKAADAVLPLRYESALAPGSAPGNPAGEAAPARLHEVLSLELGSLASVTYVHDLAGPTPRVVRGRIAVGLAPGETVALPERGVTANVRLGTFDVDAWEEALARVAGFPGAGTATGADRGGAGGDSGATARGDGAAALAYLPTTLALRARELALEGRRLNDVVVGGSREGRIWRANVDARELNGYVEYRQPAGTGAGRLHARLARLKIEANQASQVEALLAQPASIPALDIVVDDFELKGRRLGRLEIDAVNRGPGTGLREGGIREWRLNKLVLSTPEAIFGASGNWAAAEARPGAAGGERQGPPPGERRRTAMTFTLDISDAGALLARFGMRDVVRRGRGRMDGQVTWVGSPLDFDYASMDGRFHVAVENGQFLKADPGLAKLLGVLSLQSLPRRLALDFRDVFSDGFAFDLVRGDVAIDNGVAATNNLQMKGVNAAVLMEGRADLARETQDLRVVVVPEINAGTASLVATVINPALGLGSFLAQLFLREPLMRAATQEFHIDGTWSDPRVTKVARDGAPPASTTGARGAAAAGPVLR